MKLSKSRITKWVVFGLVLALGFALKSTEFALAEGYGLTVAPMYQNLIIDKNDSIKSSFKISNPSSSTQDTYYSIDIEPFYMTDEGNVVHKAESSRNEIMEWVSFDIPTEGKLSPNEVKEISFTITVPDSAPAGGQYMAIVVTASSKPSDGSNGSSDAREGNTIRKGEIYDVSVPSFLLSGDITGTSFVKNTGNVHGDAKYTLQIYPLFSNEEIYSNEEKPETRTVLPNRSMYAETKWDKTPAIGIFNVVYTVEFGDAKQQVSKMVIKCPLWLLFLVLFAVAAIIIYFVTRTRTRRGTRRDEE